MVCAPNPTYGEYFYHLSGILLKAKYTITSGIIVDSRERREGFDQRWR
jgi:hypothetical protein